MSYDLFLALVTFALVTSLSPGPNNLMLMASGANFGFRRTIPHMLGIGIGFMIMVLLVGLGLSQVFDSYPISYTILNGASLLYLLYLAWKIANAAAPQEANGLGTPMSFLQAAGFQWVNPKAWAMALSAIGLYAPDRTFMSMVWVALIFGVVNLPCVSSWTVLGQQMRRFLTNPTRLKIYNWTMAALLIASVLPVLLTETAQ